VARDERGPVDVRADSDYRTGFVTAGYDAGAWRASVRGSGYAEDRGNGTPLQVNSTDGRQVSGQVAGTAGGGAWLARAAGGSQSYYQTFSAVAAGRRTERLTTEQNTPSDFSRVSGQWIQSLGAHTLLVGGEHQQTSSTARSVTILTSGVRLAPALTGGAERSTALFARASLAATSDLSIAVGLRGDFWKSDPDDASQPVKDASFASPRASLTWRADETLALQASAYRAYRTPTLNELHRGFRVGNVVTNPNPLLEPERLTGIEGGVLVSGTRSSARATAFWNVLDDAIANITVATTPALITRERQNADRVRAAGIELEADVRPTASLTLNALAAFTASTFNKTPKQPAIEGNRVPQVPRYQLGLGATFTNPRLLTASAQLRVVGVQFDDDQNAFELEAFAVLDASVSRMLTRGTHLFVAVENLFDAEYDVGRTPVRTVGWPRTVRAGLRLFLP
jgi:outer membrane receptor protein involved in Fe transport